MTAPSNPAEVGDFVLVPREPTAAMKKSVMQNGGMQAVAYALAAWPNMLSAAPSPPIEEPVASHDAGYLRKALDDIYELAIPNTANPDVLLDSISKLAKDALASPPIGDTGGVGEVERDRWRANLQAHAAAQRMVREAIEALFGPIASLESDDAVLLRGPEPHHTAEAFIAALQRVAALVPARVEAVEPRVTDEMVERGHAYMRRHGWVDEFGIGLNSVRNLLTAALSSPPKSSETPGNAGVST